MVLGVDDLEIANTLLVYPNPTSEVLFIEKPSSLDISEIKIFNPLGQLVNQLPFTSTLDTSIWTSGLILYSISNQRWCHY